MITSGQSWLDRFLDEALGVRRYQPPTLPRDFPKDKDIGIKLYNLDVSDESAARQFIWKYLDPDAPIKTEYRDACYDHYQTEQQHLMETEIGYNPSPPEPEPKPESYMRSINLREFEDLFKLKPMIDRAIQGETPTKEDINLLNEHLQKRTEYVPAIERDLIGEPSLLLPEGKKHRTIIEESSTSGDGRLRWKIFRWIYYVWSLAIEVKRCKCKPDCKKVILADGKRVYHPECSLRAKNETDKQNKAKATQTAHKTGAKVIAEWVKDELRHSKKEGETEPYKAWEIAESLSKCYSKLQRYKLKSTDFSTAHKVAQILKHTEPFLKKEGVTYTRQRKNSQYLYVFKRV